MKNKVYKVDTTATILLGNGERFTTPVFFYVEGEDIRNKIFQAEKGASIGFGGNEKVNCIGEVYEVGNHPQVSFMGVKFPENSIKKVYAYETNNLSIHTADDNYNIGYGHLFGDEKEEVVDKFFSALNIKR